MPKREPKPLKPGECFDRLQSLETERAQAERDAVAKVRERFAKRAWSLQQRCTDLEQLMRMIDGVNTEPTTEEIGEMG